MPKRKAKKEFAGRKKRACMEAGPPTNLDRLAICQRLQAKWIRHLMDWFPELLQATYFVPPIHVNKQTLKIIDKLSHDHYQSPQATDQNQGEVTEEVFEQKETILSQHRGDKAQLNVVRRLWHFADVRHPKEVMVVLTNFNVKNYLNKNPVKDVEIPAPRNHSDPRYHQGDFDILIIHKLLGFIVLEVKATGDYKAIGGGEDSKVNLAKKVLKSLEQLEILGKQLEFITSDLNVSIPLRKALALPNTQRSFLQEVLEEPANANLKKEVMACLDSETLEGGLLKCLCQDDLLPDFTRRQSSRKIISWWKRMQAVGSMEDAFCDDTYQQLVARFCGPVSTVAVWNPSCRRRRNSSVCEVRTVGEAVHEMEVRYTMLILRKVHIDILAKVDRLLFLTGPPGSCKTLLLLLKAVQWIEEGDHVVVVRAPGNNPGHLISLWLYEHIIKRLHYLELTEERVHMETIDANTNPGEFVKGLVDKYQRDNSTLRIVIDEFWVVKLLDKLEPIIQEVSQDIDALADVLDRWPGSCHPKDVCKATHSSGVNRKTRLRRAVLSLQTAIETFDKIDKVQEDAKKLVVPEAKKMLEQLYSRLKALKEQISELGQRSQVVPAQSEADRLLEKVLDTIHFYSKAVLSWLASAVLGQITQVVRNTKHVGLWCSGLWPVKCPAGYQTIDLKTSIRCPPHVQKIMAQTEKLASHMNQAQYEYITSSTEINPPLPVEGGELTHYLNHGSHEKCREEVSECKECAHELSDFLRNKLKVGVHDNNERTSDYRDVLIVGRASLPLKEDSVFLNTLKNEEGIPLCVIVHGSDDVGPTMDVNKVLVTNTYNSHGLEKAVVVFVPVVSRCKTSSPEDDTIPGSDAQEVHGLKESADACAGLTGSKPFESSRLSTTSESCERSSSAVRPEPSARSRSSTSSEPLSIAQPTSASTLHHAQSASASTVYHIEEEKWLRRLGDYNLRGLWFVSSRCVAALIIIHV